MNATDTQAAKIVNDYHKTVYGTPEFKTAHRNLAHVTQAQAEKHNLDLFRPFDKADNVDDGE